MIEVNFDPTKIFHELSEILEKETNVYIASDPDPFEERHPSRVDQNCQLGIHLKALFKKENLVKDLFTKYLKDNYFVRAGVDKSSFDLNVATCRLVLDIMPGKQRLSSIFRIAEKIFIFMFGTEGWTDNNTLDSYTQSYP